MTSDSDIDHDTPKASVDEIAYPEDESIAAPKLAPTLENKDRMGNPVAVRERVWDRVPERVGENDADGDCDAENCCDKVWLKV